MSQCTITLSANAGVAIEFGGYKIWSDLLHDEKVPGFSTVSEELWLAIRRSVAFRDPDLIFFTHRHPDHYSRSLTLRARAAFPQARLAAPFRDFDDQILLSGPQPALTLPGLRLRFAPLPHEPEEYTDMVPNYGCILEAEGRNILIAGDCATAAPELADFVGSTPIHLALMNFPWGALRKGRAFLQRYVRPEHLVLYHLPFAEDDEFGFRHAVERSLRPIDGTGDIRILQDPLEQLTLSL